MSCVFEKILGTRLCLSEINNCDICFNKSFASSDKSKYWHETKNGDVTPRCVFKSRNNKFWFKCGECNHDFDTALSHVTNKKWCPYCAIPSKKLCPKNIDCDICFKKSFASNDKSKYWHETKNGNVTPRCVSKSNNNKFWFKCE